VNLRRRDNESNGQGERHHEKEDPSTGKNQEKIDGPKHVTVTMLKEDWEKRKRKEAEKKRNH